MQPPAHLAAEQGHEEVVEQEALGQAWVVEVKKQDGEGQGQILLGRAAESRAQQLQPSHGHKQCPAAVGKRQALGAGRWGRVPSAHPLQALAWALLGGAWLFWASDLCLCSLKRALTPSTSGVLEGHVCS